MSRSYCLPFMIWVIRQTENSGPQEKPPHFTSQPSKNGKSVIQDLFTGRVTRQVHILKLACDLRNKSKNGNI